MKAVFPEQERENDREAAETPIPNRNQTETPLHQSRESYCENEGVDTVELAFGERFRNIYS